MLQLPLPFNVLMKWSEKCWVQRGKRNFVQWKNKCKVTDFNYLREWILLQQFKSVCPLLFIYCGSVLADDYVLTHLHQLRSHAFPRYHRGVIFNTDHKGGFADGLILRHKERNSCCGWNVSDILDQNRMHPLTLEWLTLLMTVSGTSCLDFYHYQVLHFSRIIL